MNELTTEEIKEIIKIISCVDKSTEEKNEAVKRLCDNEVLTAKECANIINEAVLKGREEGGDVRHGHGVIIDHKDVIPAH